MLGFTQFANFLGKCEYLIPFREICLFVSSLVLKQWDLKPWNWLELFIFYSLVFFFDFFKLWVTHRTNTEVRVCCVSLDEKVYSCSHQFLDRSFNNGHLFVFWSVTFACVFPQIDLFSATELVDFYFSFSLKLANRTHSFAWVQLDPGRYWPSSETVWYWEWLTQILIKCTEPKWMEFRLPYMKSTCETNSVALIWCNESYSGQSNVLQAHCFSQQVCILYLDGVVAML